MNNNVVVKKVVDYIETHIDEDLPLDKIANELNYSKFYIARIFTEETKCTNNFMDVRLKFIGRMVCSGLNNRR